HDQVHAPMPASLSSKLTDLAPQGMLVFGLVFVILGGRHPVFVAGLSVQVKTRRIVAEDTPGARHEVYTIVRPGRRHRMSKHYCPAKGGLDQAGVDVAAAVVLFPFRRVFWDMPLAIERQSALGRAHRDDIVKAVSAVDIHVAGDGTQAMSGIEVPVMRDVR